MDSSQEGRGCLLSGYLGLSLVLHGLAILILGLWGDHFDIAPATRWAIVACNGAGFVGALALWNFKKSGLSCLIICTAGILWVNHVSALASFPTGLLSEVVQYAILGWLLWRVWEQFE